MDMTSTPAQTTSIAMDANEGEPGPLILQGDHRHVEIRKVILTPLIHK